MAELQIRREDAKQIASGLYKCIGEYIAAAKRDSQAEYDKFKTEYNAKQSETKDQHPRHKRTRNAAEGSNRSGR